LWWHRRCRVVSMAYLMALRRGEADTGCGISCVPVHSGNGHDDAVLIFPNCSARVRHGGHWATPGGGRRRPRRVVGRRVRRLIVEVTDGGGPTRRFGHTLGHATAARLNIITACQGLGRPGRRPGEITVWPSSRRREGFAPRRRPGRDDLATRVASPAQRRQPLIPQQPTIPGWTSRTPSTTWPEQTRYDTDSSR